MPTVLNSTQADLLRDEKAYLADLLATLTTLRPGSDDLADLRQALLQLDELFLIVVAGEFNAGKSALVNALLGQRVLREGVTPTTSQITLVKYGEKTEESFAGDVAVLTYPLDLLRELNFVDTPGTNAIVRRHEELTRDFIPRSDLVLFVTSADRPFTETERQFLEHLREWGKKIIIAINKRDIFETDADLKQVMTFVSENATQLLGTMPEIFAVSAKRAQAGDEQGSGMPALRAHIQSWLDETVRLRVKFANPLGVAEQILKRENARIDHERTELRTDSEMTDKVEREVGIFEQEVKDELQVRLSEVDNVMLRLQARGVDFFDQKFRLTNLPQLARGDQFRAEFERIVMEGVSADIDHQVQSSVNWLVEKDLRHWQFVTSFLNKRRTAVADQIVGEVTTSFDMRRQALLDSITESAQTVVTTYDVEKESRELGIAVENSVAQTALIEVGAVGIGTAITMMVSSSVLDVTGIVFAGVIAIVGFFIIPYKREQAKNRFKEKIETVRQNLNRVLMAQFNSEADRALNRLKEGVAPYLRFVRAEQVRLDSTGGMLQGASDRLRNLQVRVERVFGK
jgi:small GTP-binding protein